MILLTYFLNPFTSPYIWPQPWSKHPYPLPCLFSECPFWAPPRQVLFSLAPSLCCNRPSFDIHMPTLLGDFPRALKKNTNILNVIHTILNYLTLAYLPRSFLLTCFPHSFCTSIAAASCLPELATRPFWNPCCSRTLPFSIKRWGLFTFLWTWAGLWLLQKIIDYSGSDALWLSKLGHF